MTGRKFSAGSGKGEDGRRKTGVYIIMRRLEMRI